MLLSIVIPTKDRYPCLKETISVLSKLELESTEIIIQDNTSDNSEILAFINEKRFENVKYYHVSEKLSVNENSDLAIEHSCGEYVIFIGDDDAVTPEIIKIVKHMKFNHIDTCYSQYAKFNWSELYRFAKLNNSIEIYDDVADGSISNMDPILGLKTLLKTTIFDMKLPKVYQGIVSRSVLTKIKHKTGTYFPGPSPDLANAVGVCLLSKKAIQINAPIIIAGFSKKSASGLGTVKKHVNKIENVSWLDKDVKCNWDKRIPQIWTGQTIWAESLIKSLNKLGYKDLADKFNFVRFYSTFIISHPDLSKYVFYTSGVCKLRIIIDLPIYFTIKVIEKCKKRFINKTSITTKKEMIGLSDAICFVQNYIDNHPIKYNFFKVNI